MIDLTVAFSLAIFASFANGEIFLDLLRFIFIIFSQSLFRLSVRSIFKFVGIKLFCEGIDNICKQDGTAFTRFLNSSILSSTFLGKKNFLVTGSFFTCRCGEKYKEINLFNGFLTQVNIDQLFN